MIVGWIYRGTKPGKFVFMSMLVAAVGVFLVVTKGDPANLLGGQNTLLATPPMIKRRSGKVTHLKDNFYP